MRYEVIEHFRGTERVITTTRRENGAANERDIAVASAVAVLRKHAEAGSGRVVQGPDHRDPNATVVAYIDPFTTVYHTFSYRYVGPVRPDPRADALLADALLASVILLNGVTL